MSSNIGNKIKYSLFGESHGDEIGIVIDGLPSGVKINYEFIREELTRRRPKNPKIHTARQEKDEFRIVSGIFNGYTTGTALTLLLKNENTISRDYEKLKDVMRPSHADYSGFMRYNGFNDYRGGGHFSGRITAPLVAAGAIIKQILQEKGIKIFSHILSVGEIEDKKFINIKDNNIEIIKEKELSGKMPFIDNLDEKVTDFVSKLKENQDSVGGKIECMIDGVEAGIGDPFFDSIESIISHFIFSIPAVKGIEFGDGYKMSTMLGSIANDELSIKEGKVCSLTNHNGGINGGISNGMPILFTAFIKPTSSIGKEQKTVNIKTMENTVLKVEGRHDPCIALRMCPVIEAAAAMAIYELL